MVFEWEERKGKKSLVGGGEKVEGGGERENARRELYILLERGTNKRVHVYEPPPLGLVRFPSSFGTKALSA